MRIALAAVSLIAFAGDAAAATVGIWAHKTTLWMTYESAVIVRNIRNGKMSGVTPKDCGTFDVDRLAHVLIGGETMQIMVQGADGKTFKYWASRDNVAAGSD